MNLAILSFGDVTGHMTLWSVSDLDFFENVVLIYPVLNAIVLLRLDNWDCIFYGSTTYIVE